MNSQQNMNKKTSPRPSPTCGTMIIDNLAAAKLLADPFKLKILQHFADRPRTTKQVADLMGEKAPRLYRHVDGLLAHGLLTTIREQPKRGTIERYLQAVAARFEIDHRLFAPDNDNIAEAHSTLRSFLRKTEEEFIDALTAAEQAEPVVMDELEPLILKVAAKASRAQLIDLRQRLLDWVTSCQELTPSESDKELIDCRGLVAFYPIIENP